MELVLARIWTPVAVSISYDDNNYLFKGICPKVNKYTDEHVSYYATGTPPDRYIMLYKIKWKRKNTRNIIYNATMNMNMNTHTHTHIYIYIELT